MFKTKIYRLFNVWFDIQPQEFRLVQLAFAYITLISLFYVVGSTAGETLFLANFNAAALQKLLPWIYISTAVATIGVTWCYDRLNEKISRTTLIYLTPTLFALTLILFRQLLYILPDHPIIYFSLVVWLEACAIFSIALFFSYTGDYFNPRDARRLYGYIANGMALGSLLGGILIKIVVAYLPVPDLLYVGAIVLLLGLVPAYHMSRAATLQQKMREPTTRPPTLKTLFANKYIRYVFLIYLVCAMCYVLADYQMLIVASRTLDEKQLADFFANFFGYIGLLQLLLELFLTSWLLHRFGVLRNLFTLPILLLLTGISFSAHPTLLFAAAVNFTFLTLSETLDLLSRELLFLPLATRLRIRSQQMANGILAAAGKVLAGVVLVAFAIFKAPLWWYTWLLIGVSVTWIIAVVRAVPQYKTSLAHSLRRVLYSADLKNALLDLQKVFSGREHDRLLAKLLTTSHAIKKIFWLGLLPVNTLRRFKAQIIKLTHASKTEVAVAAITSLSHIANASDEPLLRKLATDMRFPVRLAALTAYCQLYKEDSKILATAWLTELLATDRQSTAHVLGAIAYLDDTWKQQLLDLLNDTDVTVCEAAIIACREHPDPFFIPHLINNLTTHRTLALVIKKTLCTMPSTACPVIKQRLVDPLLSETMQSILLQVLGHLGDIEVIELILPIIIKKPSPLLLATACRVMQKLLLTHTITAAHLPSIIHCRKMLYANIVTLRQAYLELGAAPSAIKQLFSDTLYFYTSILFILLGLEYSIRELADTAILLFSSDENKIANHLELLEVLLPR